MKSIRIQVKEFRLILKTLLKEMQSNNSVMSLLTDMQVKDSYVFSHSLNVTLYTVSIAMKKGFDEKKLSEIGLGALLHDIGKMRIPPEIMQKNGSLDEAELELMKKHSVYGYVMMRKFHDISLLSAHCAYQHHEKWDGTGYPRGLKGEEIHLYARILAVADVFDAMTSHRGYRRARLPHEAMDYLRAASNIHFDPEIVELFEKTIALYPIGLTVKLNTGETAVVVDHNAHSPSRPVVRMFKDPSGTDLLHYEEIDLSKHPSVSIVECDAIV